MNRILSPTKYSIACLVLLCSCAKPLPDGAYRVKVVKTSSQPGSIVRQYAIETSSLRQLALAVQGGGTFHSIAPDTMTNDRTGKADVTVTVELLEAGGRTQVTVKMTVETPGAIAKSEETLPAPGITDLATLLTEADPVGELTTATTLLRVASGRGYIEIVIE